ncbi:MAG: ferrous iron transport protein A [Firmicutes bacterium]|nr:ferrous iron transport protein A [Bacillota bacterium]
MTLAQAKKNTQVVIQEIMFQGNGRQRLLDIGFIQGASVEVKGFAPLGDPILIEVNGCLMALRKSDAKNIGIIPKTV